VFTFARTSSDTIAVEHETTMGLHFPGDWKFEESDTMPKVPEAISTRFWKILIDIADSAQQPRTVVEGFKQRFGLSTMSTSLDWAQTDLGTAMTRRAEHAVNFIESFWSALEDARSQSLATPSETQVNKWLLDGRIPFQIMGGELIRFTEPSAPTLLASISAPPGYQLGEVIGQGGFGTVHIATKETTGGTFEFAYKLLDPSPFNRDKAKALERFKREIRAVQKLQHRAIVQYVDAGLNPQGRPYLVMQRIQGRNIRDAADGNPAIAIRLMLEVFGGLEHAHSNHVLHRDLKPSNIMVRTSDEQPVILDFGTAFFLDDLETNSLSSAAVGSLGYIPPEVLANPKVRTPLHDIYSCAVILYELIARQRPNPLEYVPLAELSAKHLEPIDALLLAALGPSAKRPQTASAFRTAILKASPF
jgi:hypothetical protein